MRKKGRKGLAASRLSRRALLMRAGGLGLCSLLDRPGLFSLMGAAQQKPGKAGSTRPAPATTTLTPEDDQFLDELEKLNLQFFWEQASPQTGLVKDRCNVQTNNNSNVATIPAPGFALTPFCIEENRRSIAPNHDPHPLL